MDIRTSAEAWCLCPQRRRAHAPTPLSYRRVNPADQKAGRKLGEQPILEWRHSLAPTFGQTHPNPNIMPGSSVRALTALDPTPCPRLPPTL